MLIVPQFHIQHLKQERLSHRRVRAEIQKKQLLFPRMPNFDRDPVDYPDEAELAAVLSPELFIVMRDDADACVHNNSVIRGMVRDGGLSSLSNRSNANRVLCWMMRFFPDMWNNVDSLSNAGLMALARLKTLPLRPSLSTHPHTVLDEIELKIQSQLCEPQGTWSMDEWDSEFGRLEAAFSSALDTVQDISAHCERAATWQFTLHSQRVAIRLRAEEKADVDVSKFQSVFDAFLALADPEKIFQQFVQLVHSFLLPPCPRQRFAQTRRTSNLVDTLSNCWECFTPEAFGKSVHATFSAGKIHSMWKDKNHRFFDIFVLLAFDEYLAAEHGFRNWIDRYCITSYQYTDRYRWIDREVRDFNPRSPLVVRLLDRWYVAVGTKKLIRCRNTIEAVLVWLSEAGGCGDDGMPLDDIRTCLLPL
jgi:hypothetical protein